MQRKGVVFCLAAALAASFALGPACKARPRPDSGVVRLADRLKWANVRTSPLIGISPEAATARMPLDSIPMTEAGVGENELGLKRKLNLGSAEVDILFAPPKSEYVLDLEIPANGALDFGIGIVRDGNSEALRAAHAEADAGVDFVVRLEINGRHKTLFERHLSLPRLGEGRPINFSQNNVVLPPGAQKGRIILMTGGREDIFSFWTNPTAYTRTRLRPNVLLISIDTLRADHVGAYGYERDTTPGLDALAKDGAIFSNTYSMSPWTLPSHVALMTALTSLHHRVRYEDERLDPGRKTLADLLRSAGYFCGAFTGGGFLSPVYGFSKGFSTYGMGQGDIGGPRLAEAAAREVLPWLRTNADKEFFLFIHTYQPHSPYFAPPPYDTMFTGASPKWKKFDTVEDLGGKLSFFKSLLDEERRNIIGLYDGEIRYTDDILIQPLIAELKRLGLYENTLIIVLSDHGEEFYEHGSWGHSHNVYDESLKVPLVMKFPKSRFAGRTLSPIVRLIDVLPTVLETVGVPFDPVAFDGQSLRSILEGQDKADRPMTAFVAENVLGFRTPSRLAVTSGRDKIIVNDEFTPESLAVFPSPPMPLSRLEIYDLGLGSAGKSQSCPRSQESTACPGNRPRGSQLSSSSPAADRSQGHDTQGARRPAPGAGLYPVSPADEGDAP